MQLLFHEKDHLALMEQIRERGGRGRIGGGGLGGRVSGGGLRGRRGGLGVGWGRRGY